MRNLRLLLALLLALPIALQVGCTAVDDDDDDDSAAIDDDDVAVGEAPIISDVFVCRPPNQPGWCTNPSWVAEFRITATDADCDLANYWYFIQLEGLDPSQERVESSLGPDGCGGTLQAQLCTTWWVSGYDLPYEAWLQDAAGNLSERHISTWLVPYDTEADCPD
jgi:hypothetical protein